MQELELSKERGHQQCRMPRTQSASCLHWENWELIYGDNTDRDNNPYVFGKARDFTTHLQVPNRQRS